MPESESDIVFARDLQVKEKALGEKRKKEERIFRSSGFELLISEMVYRVRIPLGTHQPPEVTDLGEGFSVGLSKSGSKITHARIESESESCLTGL